MKTTTNFRTTRMVQLSLLIAIILLLAFSPLGYIKTPILEVTLIGIPVIVGAIVLGPASGAFLGAVFGITSFIQSFSGPFGALLLGISPILTFILCLIPRILMGWLTGLVFQFLKRNTKSLVSYSVTSLLGSLFNTIFFMSFLIIFFINNNKFQEAFPVALKGPIALFMGFAGFNAVIEAIVCMIVAGAIAKVLDLYVNNKTVK